MTLASHVFRDVHLLLEDFEMRLPLETVLWSEKPRVLGD
jgi:hypothetical protein